MNYFIGIDVGTSATKSVLFDENGNPVFSSQKGYGIIQPHNGWAQQRPDDWKNAVFDTLKNTAKAVPVENIRGIGVTGQMHGLVALDSSNNILYDSIIWCDQRTEKEVGEIIETVGKDAYINLSLNAPNTSFTLSKLLWLKNNEPDVFSKIRKILLPKDYINFCLPGRYSTDVSDASGTGFFDVAGRGWSRDILKSFNIPLDWLPKVYESADVIAVITKEISEITGLSQNTVVVAGAGDQAAAALGNGVITSGSTSISLGTSGVVFTSLDEPVYDRFGRTHTFCHAVKDKWHIMGVTQGCGLSVSWFKKNFADEYSYKQLEENAEKTTSDGLIYLPYLIGERTPYMDPNCRASFTGVSANHSVYNLYRAVLEGVCFSLKDCCDIISKSNVSINDVKVSGGGAKSSLWLHLLADILGYNLNTSEFVESGALGAAVLASVGSGFYKCLPDAAEKMLQKESKCIVPNLDNKKHYDETHKLYKRLYYALKSAYGEKLNTEI